MKTDKIIGGWGSTSKYLKGSAGEDTEKNEGGLGGENIVMIEGPRARVV